MNISLHSARLFLKRNQIFFYIIFGIFGIYAIYHKNVKENPINEPAQPYAQQNDQIAPPISKRHLRPTALLKTAKTEPSPSISVVQTMKASPGGLQIGVNQAPIIINAKPPSRHISNEQRAILLRGLRNLNITHITFVYIYGDREAAAYASEIESVLLAAGLFLERELIGQLIPPTYGIIISPDPSLATFRAAFKSSQIQFTEGHIPADKQFGVFIGLNPEE